MSGQAGDKRDPWTELFAEAIRDDRLGEPHFVDDDAFLEQWSDGSLNADQQQHVEQHLAGCAYCRDVLTSLLQRGLVELPPEVSAAIVSPAAGRRRSVRKWAIGLTAAALVLVSLSLLGLENRQINDALASAELSLDADQPLRALESLESLDQSWLWVAPGSRERAELLAEHAGYDAARPRLEDGAFSEVTDITDRVARLGANSARLRNLDLQAVHKTRAESSMRLFSELTKYGYRLDGTTASKNLDPREFSGESELRTAIAEFPADINLRMNLGHLLLKSDRPLEAAEQFREAMDLAPTNTDALLGLGIAAVEQDHIAEALDHFRAAADLDSKNFAAHLNVAICLEYLKDFERAAAYWDAASRLAPDEHWKNLIRDR